MSYHPYYALVSKIGTTHYAYKFDGFEISKNANAGTLIQAASDDLQTAGGGVLVLGAGTFDVGSTINLAQNVPLKLIGQGRDVTKINWTGNTTSRIIQTNKDYVGTANIQLNSFVTIEDLTIDANLSGYQATALAIENCKRADLRRLIIKNGTMPNPPTSGSIGFYILPTDNEKTQVDQVTVVRYDIGAKISADWVVIDQLLVSEWNTAGLNITNSPSPQNASPYATTVRMLHGFQCGGNLVKVDNTDNGVTRNPVFEVVVDEGDRVTTNFTAKGATINYTSSTNFNKGLVMGAGIRGSVNQALIAGGMRAVQVVGFYPSAMVIDALARKMYATLHYLTGARFIVGLPSNPNVLPTEGFGNDPTGHFGTYTAAAGVGNDAGLEWATVIRRDGRPLVIFKFALTTTSTQRVFIGLSNQNLTTMLGSDAPGTGAHYVGLSYSTPRGDTTFKFTFNNGSGTASSIDTLFPVDTNPHLLVINVGKGGEGVGISLHPIVGMETQGENGAISAPPSATTNLNILFGIENQSGGSSAVLRAYKMDLWAT